MLLRVPGCWRPAARSAPASLDPLPHSLCFRPARLKALGRSIGPLPRLGSLGHDFICPDAPAPALSSAGGEAQPSPAQPSQPPSSRLWSAPQAALWTGLMLAVSGVKFSRVPHSLHSITSRAFNEYTLWSDRTSVTVWLLVFHVVHTCINT